jgi:phospholipid/cholesterol/gamma-HCH transport system substrate-binding protein
LAGLFFIGGIALILVFVFMIGQDKGITQPKFKANILFSNVGGLIEGAPVQLAGVHVGTVSAIYFLDKPVNGRVVNVEVNIFSKFRRQISEDAIFSIKTEGILGEKLIEITSADGPVKEDYGQPIFGDNPINVQDLAQVFSDAAQSFTKTSDDFSKVDVQRLSKILAETAETLAETSRGINTVLTEMQYIAIKSKRILDRLEQQLIEGDLFKVF